MGAQLERTIFETSRAREYFDRAELQAQTGQPAYNFATVVLKELVDNGLDAAETVGRAPAITIEVAERTGALRLSVQDNGAGIQPETVARILNFHTRTSDKAAYRAPTRGAQGNALKTVLGIPFALGSLEPVVIEACGVRHVLFPRADPTGDVQVIRTEEPAPQADGTRVTVALPNQGQEFCPAYWARAFALFNPHAAVRIRCGAESGEHAQSDEAETTDSYRPSVSFPGDWRKFLPTDLTSPWWYDPAALSRLVFSHIKATREGARDLPLREFVQQFRGLSGTAKAKRVKDALPAVARLSDFETRPDLTGDLLDAMRSVTGKPPSAAVLGCVGEEHLLRCLGEWHGAKRHWYRRVSEEVDGIPYVCEVLVTEARESSGFYHAVNFSPTFEDPLASTYLRAEQVEGYGARGFLAAAHASPFEETEGRPRVAAAVHLICPAALVLDRGKTRLQVPPAAREAIARALWGAAKELWQEEERRRKDAARQERREREQERQERRQEWNLKEAVFEVLPQAMEHASGGGAYPVSARTLFYQVRPLIQAYTRRELDYTYFSQELLTQYREAGGDLPGLYYDPRGILYEPHTGREVKLGTREVDAYQFPAWLYNKILYVEKKGLWPVLQQARLAERYDLAVIAAEGYATEAARVLFQHADRGQSYQLFALHDADPAGYNIARTLGEETRRMPGYQVDVIDLGLKLETALELGLQPEEFTRKARLPAGLEPGLTETEREHFVGRQVGFGRQKSWICRRVELNAFTAPALVQHIEAQLEAAGAVGKVIPSEPALPPLAEEMYREALHAWVDEELARLVSADALKSRLAEQFRSQVPLESARQWIEAGLQDDPAQSWREVLRARLRGTVGEQREALRGALRAEVEAVLAR